MLILITAVFIHLFIRLQKRLYRKVAVLWEHVWGHRANICSTVVGWFVAKLGRYIGLNIAINRHNGIFARSGVFDFVNACLFVSEWNYND